MFAMAIADQVADQGRVFAQVARHGEHRLGGSDRVVEAAQGDLGAEAHLQSARQRPHLLHFGEQQADAVGLELEQDLPVGGVEPCGPVGLAQGEAAVMFAVLSRAAP